MIHPDTLPSRSDASAIGQPGSPPELLDLLKGVGRQIVAAHRELEPLVSRVPSHLHEPVLYCAVDLQHIARSLGRVVQHLQRTPDVR